MKKQIIIVMLFWLFAIIASLGLNIRDDKREYENLAIESARALFKQIVIDRSWNAGHGGVYVPVTEDTQPNPYLEGPLRDITTLEGLTLTKINPAFMTRQISQIAANQNGVQFHITSLKPIRPANKPDDWEAQWLQSFADGVEEQSALVRDGKKTFFRYMAPLFTESGCLKCHAKQGYKLGEIRGGISVTLPFVTAKNNGPLWVSHGVALFIGFIGILLFGLKTSLAESKRRKGEILLQGILESTAYGILVVNERGQVMHSNGQFAKLWKVPTEIIENPDDEKLLNHVQDRLMESQAFLAKVQEFDRSTKDDFDTLYLKDGRILEYYSYSLIQDGRISGRVLSFRDITERKKTAEELQKLSMATEHSPAAVIITDPQGTIEYVNPTFSRITGYSFDEVIGQNPRILKSGKHSPDFYKELWETIIAGRVWHGELTNKKKNGEIYWESTSISPILNSKGESTHFVAVKEDITEKKAAEEDLRTRAENLADTRLAMLNMMKDLDDAKGIAEEATRAKSDFLANMSHEIRTPMNAIIGMSHLALKTELDSKQLDYLNKIDISAKSLLGIINDILDFSKIEAGKLVMESSKFQLEDVLNNLANLVGIKAQEKGLELLFNVDKNTPTALVGDPLRLGQILINLANNAVKFTETGEIVISASLVEKSESQANLKFSVQDSGIGLTDEQISKLFMAFSQADASITRKYGGTGLGLTISKRLCEMMGGEIWVESVPGEGSTFIFTAMFGLHAEMKIPLLPEPDLRGKRVLVVDDNQMSREILHEMLEGMTFKVSQTVSGKEALSEVSRADNEGLPYEVVYMDWQLPGLDGIATSRSIKDLELSLQPKIIMVTAYGREEIMQQAEDVGLEGFLVKPVTRSLLFDATMQAFGRERVRTHETRLDKVGEIEALKDIRGARILLAEDNEINQQVAQEILEQAAFVVEIANNGLEALEMAEKNPYDVILMDIQMPEMSGYEATEQIRNLKSEIRKVPIIAMTAHAMSGDKEKSIEAGMNDHVTKPIDPNQLFSTLIKWVKPGEREIPIEETFTEELAENEEVLLPEELLNIDQAAGLARLGGNKRLYKNLLLKILEDYADADTTIEFDLERGNLEEAKILAHSIKGVAGNVGAHDLQEAAGGLEVAINEGQVGANVLANFSGALKMLMSSLTQIQPDMPESVTDNFERREGSREDMIRIIKEFEPHIRAGKPKKCKPLKDKIGEYSWPDELNDKLNDLVQLITKFKFKQAVPLLESILQETEGGEF